MEISSVNFIHLLDLTRGSYIYIYIYIYIFCVGVMYSGKYDVCDVTLSVYISTPAGKLEKYACMATVGIEPTTFGILAQCSAN